MNSRPRQGGMGGLFCKLGAVKFPHILAQRDGKGTGSGENREMAHGTYLWKRRKEILHKSSLLSFTKLWFLVGEEDKDGE